MVEELEAFMSFVSSLFQLIEHASGAVRLMNFVSTLFQHWIRLELQPDVLISSLNMRVEPSDSSYMPSLVVISGGDSIHTMKELKTINIGATETIISLLQELTEVS